MHCHHKPTLTSPHVCLTIHLPSFHLPTSLSLHLSVCLVCQCLDTIIAVLDAVQEHPSTMLALELLLLPLLQQLMGPAGAECYEYLDNAIDMLNYCTFANEGNQCQQLTVDCFISQ